VHGPILISLNIQISIYFFLLSVANLEAVMLQAMHLLSSFFLEKVTTEHGRLEKSLIILYYMKE